MARMVLMAEVIGSRVRGGPRLGWMHGMMMNFGSRGMRVEAVRQYSKNRKEWRTLVHMLMIEFHVPIFA